MMCRSKIDEYVQCGDPISRLKILSFFEIEMVESIAKCIVELDMECLCCHGHRYEALPIISELEAIFLGALVESLE